MREKLEREPKGGLLVCTLGTTWAVVPEVLALLAPDVVDLYRSHPSIEEIRREVANRRLPRPDEVWVATTQGTGDAVRLLHEYWGRLAKAPRLRIWQVSVPDLKTPAECAIIRELIFRLVAHATERVGVDRVVLSLAGGRKTMSADMQWAGTWFGCAACVHVLDTGSLPPELRNPTPEVLATPLRADIAGSLFPVFLGPFAPSDLLFAETNSYGKLDVASYPIGSVAEDSALAGEVERIAWEPEGPYLVDELLDRERHKTEIYAGHVERLLREEGRPNWYGLYRLSPQDIEFLRRTQLSSAHRDWLRLLPKADLHCHLGGVLDLAAQREVARALWESLAATERQRARDAVPWRREKCWPEDWGKLLRSLPNRSEAAAAILVELDEEEIARHLFSPTEPRVALRTAAERGGFAAYERPGELSGSALLQREGAVGEYARQVVARLQRDGVRYCELRGSPLKYLRGQDARFLRAFAAAVGEARRALEEPPDVRFLVVLDRRQAVDPARLQQFIDNIVRDGDLRKFVVGLDVAGDESCGQDFSELARMLEPAFEACLPLTIHAGEGESAENIWQAVYHLHAERVGHGLTLEENGELARRMRDRGIAIELCPTSNLEVVGYCDPEIEETADYAEYPLRSYLRDLELDVVICTDNPGISRTDLASEYLRASRMAGGLSLWQVLSLVRAGFEHAFAPADVRAEMLRRADVAVVRYVSHLLHGETAGGAG